MLLGLKYGGNGWWLGTEWQVDSFALIMVLQRGAAPEAKIVKSSSSCDNLAENIYYMLHNNVE